LGKYAIGKMRNVGLISHQGAGKTSLAEAMLYTSGVIDRLGRVDDSTATLDYDPEEQRRKVSISTALAHAEWAGHRVTIVDMPGYFDFVGEVKAGLRVVDSVAVLIDAVSGIEVGTELVWRYADELRLPRMVVVNKMDRENANWANAVASLTEVFGDRIVPVLLPIGQESGFRGVVDLLAGKAYTFAGDASGKMTEGDIPADLVGAYNAARERLVEKAAEADDELTMKYLEEGDLSREEIATGLAAGTRSGRLVPVAPCSALKCVGAQKVLETMVSLLPSPADRPAAEGVDPRNNESVARAPSDTAPFSALVYKTMADPYVGRLTLFRVFSGILRSDGHTYNPNRRRSERIGQVYLPRGKQQDAVDHVSAGEIGAVAKLQETVTGDTLCDEAHPIVYEPMQFPSPVYAVAARPKSKGDEEKIGSGLARLTEEDPTVNVNRDAETAQLLVSGMGELQLDILTDRLKRKFGVEVQLSAPRMPYRETIRGSVRAQGRHKKQTGGRGQFGDVWIEMEPLESGQGFEFVDKIFGGSVPRQYIPAVEKGVREAMGEGIVAGYPVTDFRITLVDGSFHPVDSSEMAFKIAGSLAFKKAAAEARPVLLEPIVTIEVMVPDQYMGEVIGDLNKKRGRILGMEPSGRMQVVRAQAPQAEVSRYAIDLRSITQGRGTFQMQFSHYEEVPGNIAEQVIEKARKAREEQ
jgi:elongation factor G